MRVLLATGIYPPEIGGPATFVPIIAAGLRSAGHEVKVVSYGDSATKSSPDWKVRVVSRQGSAFKRYLRFAYATYHEARDSDLIFLQGAVSEGVPGTIGAIFARKPTILRVPGDYAWEQAQQRTEADPEPLDLFIQHRHTGAIGLMERLERWVAKRARCVVVPSRYLKNIVMRWGIASEAIEVVYNDVPPLPASSQEPTALRQQFRIAANAKILFCVARAVPWKGVDFLLSLLPDLPDAYVLVVAGDGPMLSAWRAKVQADGLTHRAFFVGRWPHEQLASWFQAADAFVLASGYEGFPHVAVEAAMQGLHGFLSDAGGNPETREVLPGYTTILPYQDRQAWINALSVNAFPKHEPFSLQDQMSEQIRALLERVVN